MPDQKEGKRPSRKKAPAAAVADTADKKLVVNTTRFRTIQLHIDLERREFRIVAT